MGCSAGAMEETLQPQQCDIETSVQLNFEEYSVSLEKGTDDILGVKMKILPDNGGLQVCHVDGHVKSYNSSNRGTPILFDDMFVAVNGQTCADFMINEMVSSGMLSMKMRRPRHCLMTIRKLHPHATIGVAVRRDQSSKMLIIASVSKKLFLQSKEFRVRPNDVITSVNNLREDTEAMLSELQGSETLTLEVWHPAALRWEVLEGVDTNVAAKECTICMTMCEPVILRSLPCRHDFCISCLSNWLVNHNTCPYCRRSVDVR